MPSTIRLRIDGRDEEFLHGLGRYGLLSTEDARDFYPELRHNSLQKRLRSLAGCGLVRATKLSVWFADDSRGAKGGRIPTLYALTEEGATVVETRIGERPPRVLRSNPAPGTFLHRREIVRVMRAFDRGCAATGLARPEWIMEQDPWPNAPKGLPPNQRRLLYHDFGSAGICVPDIACRFRIGQTELALFWEVDLSTEGRKQLQRASKGGGYVALLNEWAYRRYWPDFGSGPQFVLWTCPTERRVDTLRDVLRGQPVALVCRFVTCNGLANPEQLLTAEVWQTITGEHRAMFCPSA